MQEKGGTGEKKNFLARNESIPAKSVEKGSHGPGITLSPSGRSGLAKKKLRREKGGNFTPKSY